MRPVQLSRFRHATQRCCRKRPRARVVPSIWFRHAAKRSLASEDSSESRALLLRELTRNRKYTAGELLVEQNIFPSDTSKFEIEEDEPLSKAAQQMVRMEVGSLVVMSGGVLSGIITERDYLRAMGNTSSEAQDASSALRVADIMTTREKLVTVTSDIPVSRCVSLMSENQFRHLPVVRQLAGKEDQVIGMISAKMLLGKMLEYHELQVTHLQNFLPFQVW